MKTKHTPTPWKVGPGPSVMVGRYNVAPTITPGGSAKGMLDEREVAAANAAFIVRAANSHDQLVDALQVFAQFADSLDESAPDNIELAIFAGGAVRFGPAGGATVGDLRKARAALAAAEA